MLDHKDLKDHKVLLVHKDHKVLKVMLDLKVLKVRKVHLVRLVQQVLHQH
jgi:hypothetical protein